jgi:hypothetical protein
VHNSLLRAVSDNAPPPSPLLAAAQVPRSRRLRTLAAAELAELCYAKYDRYHDLSIYSAQPFGKENRQVALNIYGEAAFYMYIHESH